MPLDPDVALRAQAYTRVFAESDDVRLVLDDLVAQAGAQQDAQIRAGYLLAVHRCYAMRSLTRRKGRK